MNEENQSEIAVKITDLNKEYKMYKRKSDRFLETVFPFIKKHTNFKAMDSLNLDIYKGEVLGILGKNGAGKSTLLKMITGVVTPTSGTLEVNGKISSLLELGTAFNLELTGIENIYQHGQVMGLTNAEIEEKKQEIIDFADIGEHLYQPVKTYSSGMFARLAFACAINVDPDILIVDEVLSVGDMAFQLKCFKKFEEFKNRGKTIIFVTHSISDVINNCTRAIIINSGRKIFDGEVKEAVEQYKQIIIGIEPKKEKSNEKNTVEDAEKNKLENIKNDNKNENTWKSKCTENPNLIEYGNKKAEVIDYGIFDEEGKVLNVVENGNIVVMKSKIKFNEDIKDPIFTMTIKDFHGREICGTNTLIEKILTGEFKKGDIVIVTFKQYIPIAPNKYTVSFSCTKFNEKGELEVLNRKYDALLVEFIASKGCVGIVSLNSEISFKKE